MRAQTMRPHMHTRIPTYAINTPIQDTNVRNPQEAKHRTYTVVINLKRTSTHPHTHKVYAQDPTEAPIRNDETCMAHEDRHTQAHVKLYTRVFNVRNTRHARE